MTDLIPATLGDGDGDEPHRVFQRQRTASTGGDAPDLASRLAALERLKRVLLDNRQAIAQAISADFGVRSTHETELLELVPLINSIRYTRARLPRWMRPERRHVDWAFQPARAWVQHQPLGVVGIISPWNYPLLLALSPLNDALAAGNRVMLKPSEFTPGFATLLKQLLSRIFDEAEVAVVLGGPDTAAAFSRLPFDHLLFTGSTAVGRKVMQAAAENLTPVTLELGGKSPAVVCPDYPLAQAARSLAFGKFVNAGQTCIAPDYVLAPVDRAEALAQALLAEARRMYPSVATNPDYAAIITSRHFERLSAGVAQARAVGARVLTHEDSGAAGARKLGPTIVLDPPADGLLMRDEIFGPVLPIIGYRTLADAVDYINARERPLALYCFSHSPRARDDILRRTVSGGVTLNGTLLHIAQDSLPFGGVGASGIGAYHGVEGFRRFSHARAVHKVGWVNVFEKLAPPYGRLTALASGLMTRR